MNRVKAIDEKNLNQVLELAVSISISSKESKDPKYACFWEWYLHFVLQPAPTCSSHTDKPYSETAPWNAWLRNCSTSQTYFHLYQNSYLCEKSKEKRLALSQSLLITAAALPVQHLFLLNAQVTPPPLLSSFDLEGLCSRNLPEMFLAQLILLWHKSTGKIYCDPFFYLYSTICCSAGSPDFSYDTKVQFYFKLDYPDII